MYKNQFKVINASNYINPALNNGLLYGAGNFACNYPINQQWSAVGANGSPGESFIEINTGFSTLLGSKPFGSRPTNYFILDWSGQIIEIDCIINDTLAKTKYPIYKDISGTFLYSIDYYGQPEVEATHIGDNGTYPITRVNYASVFGEASVPSSAFAEENLGNNPICADLTGYGSTIIEIYYRKP